MQGRGLAIAYQALLLGLLPRWGRSAWLLVAIAKLSPSILGHYTSQAYTQRFSVDRLVSLINEVARGARSAAAAEADMAAYKVGTCGRRSRRALLVHRCACPADIALWCRLLNCWLLLLIPNLLVGLRCRQVDVPACPPTEAVLRVIPRVEGGHPGAQVTGLAPTVNAGLPGMPRHSSVPSAPFPAPFPHLHQVRLAGDRYVFLEYGPMELDISLRVR